MSASKTSKTSKTRASLNAHAAKVTAAMQHPQVRSIGSDIAKGAAVTLGVVAVLETVRGIKALVA